MSKKKLLIADDSVTIQKVFELAFENEDIAITLAGDGETALQLVHASPPDLIIADINMPGIDGFELCRQLQENPVTAAIPVYLLASALDEFDDERATDAGATGRFEKPFRSEEMVVQVHEALENATTTTALANADEEPEEAPSALLNETMEEPSLEDVFEDIDVPLETLDVDLDAIIPAPEEPPMVVDEAPEVEEEVAPTVIIHAAADAPPIIELNSAALNEEELSDEERLAVEVVSDEEEEEPLAIPVSEESSAEEESYHDAEEPSTRTGLPASIEAASLDVVSVDDEGTSFTHDISSEGNPTTLRHSSANTDGELSPEARELLRAIDAEAGELGDEEGAELRHQERETSPPVSQESDKEPATPTFSDEQIETAINAAVQRMVERMKPQILSAAQKVAEDVTLRVAEDLVRQTIEQIRTADEE